MKLHANAALSFRQRERMVRRVVEEGWSVSRAAEAAEVSDRTAGKWAARYRSEGTVGLLDRSSAPLVVANRSDERTVHAIAALRRLRFTGPEISEVLEFPVSTVSGILSRIGMGRLGRLGMEPAVDVGARFYSRKRAASFKSSGRRCSSGCETQHRRCGRVGGNAGRSAVRASGDGRDLDGYLAHR